MKIMLRAALGLIVSVISTTAAQAADFITYTFHTSGTGSILDVSSGLPVRKILNGFDFVYVVPVSGFEVTTGPSSQTFSQPARIGGGIFNGGSTMITATTTGLSFFDEGFTYPSEHGALGASACSPLSGMFPSTSFAANPACGSASVSYSARSLSIQYTGAVYYVDAVAGTGTPAHYGLVGFAGNVPEPATWLLTLAGFGLVGYAMRRRLAMTRAPVCRE